jgi:NACalpha-BTF3-like transcription factor
VCYLKYCPELFAQHKAALKENDTLREEKGTLRKENASLKLKLQEAQEGVPTMDVQMVMSQAGCTRVRAVKALKDNDKDVIEAIMSLV